VVDGDVSSNGNIESRVPGSKYFDMPGPGGYPGIPVHGTGTNLNALNVSATRWLAQSTSSNIKKFDYSFFASQIPEDTLIHEIPSNSLDQGVIDANTTPSYGYYWYRFNGVGNALDVNVSSAIDIGNKKVIVLIDSADLNINAPINLTDGEGFFMVSVGKNSDGTEGDISVSPAIGGASYVMEGLYQADSEFTSGVAATPLNIRGSVVAYDGFNLQRDLGDIPNFSPAEIFTYAPDQIMLFPSKLGTRRLNWKEVAP
jgi:hypothetical protein